MKDKLKQNQSIGKDSTRFLDVEPNLMFPHGSGTSGGSRAGLFRTPISGGVQSATSAHGLPRPALAVRNLMEQVILLFSVIPFFRCFIDLMCTKIVLVCFQGQICSSMYCDVSYAP